VPVPHFYGKTSKVNFLLQQDFSAFAGRETALLSDFTMVTFYFSGKSADSEKNLFFQFI
jgi:hypothetical protein